ncbi:histone H3-lysine(4) N-trimethyltransferase ATX1-like [Telopea speciosissima]|uniref:histone H3-lysine(4) N-trimethyltransferase ATX1-like n=1 Tax=Telopea speciosissima TaxID=54955 RepID=UPI001CC51201|nr:histone H3-lysine(4) N-trimethyltransferase ATX1-like [Telopea speciosissima]
MATSPKFMHEAEETEYGSPIRYLPLHHVYCATSPCDGASGSSNVMSEKVKARARELIDEPNGDPPNDSDEKGSQSQSSLIVNVYTRRAKRHRHCMEKRVESESKSPNGDDNSGKNRADELKVGLGSVETKRIVKKNKKADKYELIKLGVESTLFHGLDGPGSCDKSDPDGTSRLKLSMGGQKTDRQKVSSGSCSKKKWIELSIKDFKPNTFVGLQCKVYWPLDDAWYSGCIVGYNSETNLHQVEYADGDAERLILSEEKVRFYLSQEEMQQLKLRCSIKNVDIEGLDYGELAVLAASFDDCQELEPGDVIWAKLIGHSMWPAIVLNEEAHISAREGLKPTSVERSITVQFFGTHDFARISRKQVIPFIRGLLSSSFHLKCKQTRFRRSLEEAKLYLSEEKLPKGMLRLQNNINTDDCRNASPEEGNRDSNVDVIDEGSHGTLEGIQSDPLEFGDLRVISLGKIVRDSDFQNEQYIWPEGYIAERKFTSMSDPLVSTFYKMEVLRDPETKFQPLFRVTADTGEQVSCFICVSFFFLSEFGT